MTEEEIIKIKKNNRFKTILIVLLTIVGVVFVSLFVITKLELNNQEKCETMLKVEDNKIEENKTDETPTTEDENTEYNGKDYNSNASLTTTTINGSKEYQNYIKTLSSNQYYKVINITDFYEIYTSTNYYVGYDQKLYAVLENESLNTNTILPADDYHDGIKGYYTGIDNVLDIYHGEIGNGGYDFVIILRTDGYLYFVNIEQGKNYELERINDLTNIVNVFEVYDIYAHQLYATDIDGNIKNINLPKFTK